MWEIWWSGARKDIPSPLLFNIILVVLDNYALCSHGWETKDVHIGQDKIKLSLFTDDVIVYSENSKEST